MIQCTYLFNTRVGNIFCVKLYTVKQKSYPFKSFEFVIVIFSCYQTKVIIKDCTKHAQISKESNFC